MTEIDAAGLADLIGGAHLSVALALIESGDGTLLRDWFFGLDPVGRDALCLAALTRIAESPGCG